eukprot:315290-Chlamydomonas_euryale.AAC.4
MTRWHCLGGSLRRACCCWRTARHIASLACVWCPRCNAQSSRSGTRLEDFWQTTVTPADAKRCMQQMPFSRTGRSPCPGPTPPWAPPSWQLGQQRHQQRAQQRRQPGRQQLGLQIVTFKTHPTHLRMPGVARLTRADAGQQIVDVLLGEQLGVQSRPEGLHLDLSSLGDGQKVVSGDLEAVVGQDQSLRKSSTWHKYMSYGSELEACFATLRTLRQSSQDAAADVSAEGSSSLPCGGDHPDAWDVGVAYKSHPFNSRVVRDGHASGWLFAMTAG